MEKSASVDEMEAAAGCCALLGKNFGVQTALPIRISSNNARSFIIPPQSTRIRAHDREVVPVDSKIQEGAPSANLQMFLYINNQTNTLKRCANQVTEGHVRKSVEKEIANSPHKHWSSLGVKDREAYYCV